jgi:hypothetical protein
MGGKDHRSEVGEEVTRGTEEVGQAPGEGAVEEAVRVYEAYRFRTKDPAIDEFRTVAQDHFGVRNFTREHYDTIEEQGGPSWSTVRQWFQGKTRKPQNATLEAAGRALGYHRVWRKNGS